MSTEEAFVIATCALLMSVIAALSTSGILCGNVLKSVTKSVDYFLALGIITTRAILVSGVTGVLAICCLTLYINEIVTKSFALSLATRALLRIGASSIRPGVYVRSLNGNGYGSTLKGNGYGATCGSNGVCLIRRRICSAPIVVTCNLKKI